VHAGDGLRGFRDAAVIEADAGPAGLSTVARLAGGNRATRNKTMGPWRGTAMSNWADELLATLTSALEDHPFANDPLRAALVSLNLCCSLREKLDPEELELLDSCTYFWMNGECQIARRILLGSLYERLEDREGSALPPTSEARTRLLISSVTLTDRLNAETCGSLVRWAEAAGLARGQVESAFRKYLSIR
jgi:hypothetical protein